MCSQITSVARPLMMLFTHPGIDFTQDTNLAKVAFTAGSIFAKRPGTVLTAAMNARAAAAKMGFRASGTAVEEEVGAVDGGIVDEVVSSRFPVVWGTVSPEEVTADADGWLAIAGVAPNPAPRATRRVAAVRVKRFFMAS